MLPEQHSGNGPRGDHRLTHEDTEAQTGEAHTAGGAAARFQPGSPDTEPALAAPLTGSRGWALPFGSVSGLCPLDACRGPLPSCDSLSPGSDRCHRGRNRMAPRKNWWRQTVSGAPGLIGLGGDFTPEGCRCLTESGPPQLPLRAEEHRVTRSWHRPSCPVPAAGSCPCPAGPATLSATQRQEMNTSSDGLFSKDPPPPPRPQHFPLSPALPPPGHAPIAGAPCSGCRVPSPNCPCTLRLSSHAVPPLPPGTTRSTCFAAEPGACIPQALRQGFLVDAPMGEWKGLF